jgi:hypothetical protein
MTVGNTTKLLSGVLSIFFAALALLFGVYGLFTCNAVEFPQKQGDGAISVGLYGYRTKSYTLVDQGDTTDIWVSDVCIKFDGLNSGAFTYTVDKLTESLQGLAISVAVIGFVFAILSCVIPCVPEVSHLAWKGLGLMFLVCCILQGCSLLLLQSSICLDNPVIQFFEANNPALLATLEDPDKCALAPGIKMSISAVAFWFVAGIIPLFLPPPSFSEEVEPIVPAKPDIEAEAVEQPQEKAGE